MKFFDELKRLTHPYEDEMDEEYDDDEYFDDEEEDEEPEEMPQPPRQEKPRQERPRPEAPRRRDRVETQPPRRPADDKVVNMHAPSQLQVVLVKPDKYGNGEEIADHLMDMRTVVLNMEKTEKDTARRLLDFLSGVAYAQKGDLKRVADNTYIVTPCNVNVVGDLLDELKNSEAF